MLCGIFLPNKYYFDTIQKVVHVFNSNSQPDYTIWLQLRLNVQLGNGCFLHPAGGYNFSDIAELPDEPIRIDITGIDYHVINDYFIQESPVPFLNDPWSTINVKRKIELEEQLKKNNEPKEELCKNYACGNIAQYCFLCNKK